MAEVFGNFFDPGAEEAAYPGVDSVIEVAADFCSTEFESYVDATYAESSLDYWWYYPDEEDWDNGLGFVMCSLVDFGGGELVGSAWQTGW